MESYLQSPLQRFQNAVAFKETSQPPLIVGPISPNILSEIAAISPQEYYSNVNSKIKAHLSFFHKYPDIVLLYSPSFEYEAETTAFGSSNYKPILRDALDIESMEIPDPYSDGQCPQVLDEMRAIIEKVDDEYKKQYGYPRFGCLEGPARLASLLWGPENLYINMIRNPTHVRMLLKKTCEFEKRWLEAQKKALGGLYGFYIAEEELAFISPRHSVEYILPYMKDICESFRDSIMIWHSDPDVSHSFNVIRKVGAKVLNFKLINFPEALRKLANDVCLLGGVDCEVLVRFTPYMINRIVRERIRMARRITGKKIGFICSSTAILNDVPLLNLDALIQAIREYW